MWKGRGFRIEHCCRRAALCKTTVSSPVRSEGGPKTSYGYSALDLIAITSDHTTPLSSRTLSSCCPMQNPLAYMRALRLYTSRLFRLSPYGSLVRTAIPRHPAPAPAPTTSYREMTTKSKSGIPHQIRTAAEPRQNCLYAVRLSHIDQVNPAVRLFQLTIPPQVQCPETDDEAQDGQVSTPTYIHCKHRLTA